MDLSDISLIQLGLGAIASVAIVVIALYLWRTLKQSLGGCVSSAIGCLALVIGLVAIALFFLTRAGITNLEDLRGVLESLF